jgi:uncharacterized protein (TIGR03382 family)
MKITVATANDAADAARSSAKPVIVVRMQTLDARKAMAQSTVNAIPTPGAIGLMVAAVVMLVRRRRGRDLHRPSRAASGGS